MLPNTGVTERLASFVLAARCDELTPQVLRQAKRSVMNFFAVALAGCRDATVETALASLAVFSGGKQATIVGRRERIDALSAACLNAAGANVLDFCDTHTPTGIHPTAPILPALLALAELKRVSGRDLLLALVLGQETACRIGLAISPSHYSKGWHITATCGAFGAAAGSGKLLGLTAEQMVWAFGTAATQAAGLCECLGTPAKSVGVGNAARNGLWSALLAARNFSGPVEPLNGGQGYFHALGETPDLSRMFNGLGGTWEILKTSYKPYPCGFVLHPVIDCVLDWRRDHRNAVVENVVVTGNPLLSVRADRPNISTGRESQVSVQHAVAAAIITGEAGLNEFTDACVQDARVQALRSKITVVRDTSIPTIAATVDVTTADGVVHKLSQTAARGSDLNPMTDQDLEDKLRAVASQWNPRYDTTTLIDAIWQLDESGDVSKLAALTVPRDSSSAAMPGQLPQ
jgi:2-methylcitrate dehydratase PrpD